MDDDFRNKLVVDLQNSGFASEMAAIQTFLRNDWKCSGNAVYFDKDEQKTREIDLVAHCSQHLNESIHFTFVQPVVIIDGMLLSTQLYDLGEIEISEIDAAPMVFRYRSEKYNSEVVFGNRPMEKDYRIDIVRLNSLSEYLERCSRRLQTITQAIHQKVLSFG